MRAAPWAALALGLATTAVLDSSIAGARAQRHREEFDREVAHIKSAISDAVRRQVSVVEATAGVVSATPELDQAGFTRFYDRLTRGKDAAMTEAIGLTLGRPWARRGELAAEAARRGVRNFRLRPEAPPRPEAHAVVLIGPLDAGNAEAPGFDMHAEPVRRAAMDRAQASDRVAMTSAVFLAKDRGRRVPAFILYLPVQRPEGGLVYAAVHADRLFGDLFAGDPNAETLGLRLWSGMRDPAFDRPIGVPAAYGRELTIPIREVATTLRAEVIASAEFGSKGTIRPYVLPTGAVLSLLLFLLASNLRRAQETSARREAEQSLLAEVGRLTAGRPDADDVLREIANRAAVTLEAVCRIDLREGDTLRTVNTREIDPSYALLERDYPRLQSDPLLRQAMETVQTQRSVGYRSIDEGHRARLADVDVGPVMIVPLGIGERALGALTLTRRRGQPDFTPEAVGLAEAIAGRMALAIENERLYHDLERRVEERTRELEASNHELESFCYSVSHDLRTPLRSLDGFGRMLQEDYSDRLDAQGLDYLARIRAASRRMDELITALLTLSRLTRREIVPKDVDVSRLVCDAMGDLDPESRVRLTVEDGLSAWADPRMLAVVFDNLLGNAVKFGARNAAPEIVVGRDADGSIFVRDNGAGFDMAYAAKLFQPFERLHSAREFPGHGIGLATVERIVRRHGGEVRAEGRPGGGATFYVRFPQ